MDIGYPISMTEVHLLLPPIVQYRGGSRIKDGRYQSSIQYRIAGSSLIYRPDFGIRYSDRDSQTQGRATLLVKSITPADPSALVGYSSISFSLWVKAGGRRSSHGMCTEASRHCP